uniref:Galactose oxidase n=1 Tax=Kalanchoe fedtschenkoi TaxID=63787 RepID=A0A7N0VJQ7_KALFE
MVQTDSFCSSGSIDADGTLIQTGGYRKGDRIIRMFSPCDDESCDWEEQQQSLAQRRWYATNHILPDNRIIIVGGRAAFTYEFYPKAAQNSTLEKYYLPFLRETRDGKEENNLYPFVYLLPDGNLYIFANNRSISFDYKANRIAREYQVIPGERRTYPLTGSSVLLPIHLAGIRAGGQKLPQAEVLICGGSVPGAYFKARDRNFVTASSTCGRLRVTDPDPKWVMEEMPMPRLMPDMLLLPTGDVLIINGVKSGAAGWERGRDPVQTPLLYRASDGNTERRFRSMADSQTPRLYHSVAALVPDGRVLVGGSNPHVKYDFNDTMFPTDLSLEAFYPPYLAPIHRLVRPRDLAVVASNNVVSYEQVFSVTFSVSYYKPLSGISVNIIQPPFVTHSFGMNQRMVVLEVLETAPVSASTYKVSVRGPTTVNVAPHGYYMLFIVHDGIPSTGVWIKVVG